jgi:hypothetical protein
MVLLFPKRLIHDVARSAIVPILGAMQAPFMDEPIAHFPVRWAEKFSDA